MSTVFLVLCLVTHTICEVLLLHVKAIRLCISGGGMSGVQLPRMSIWGGVLCVLHLYVNPEKNSSVVGKKMYSSFVQVLPSD